MFSVSGNAKEDDSYELETYMKSVFTKIICLICISAFLFKCDFSISNDRPQSLEAYSFKVSSFYLKELIQKGSFPSCDILFREKGSLFTVTIQSDSIEDVEYLCGLGGMYEQWLKNPKYSEFGLLLISFPGGSIHEFNSDSKSNQLLIERYKRKFQEAFVSLILDELKYDNDYMINEIDANNIIHPVFTLCRAADGCDTVELIDYNEIVVR